MRVELYSVITSTIPLESLISVATTSAQPLILMIEEYNPLRLEIGNIASTRIIMTEGRPKFVVRAEIMDWAECSVGVDEWVS